jgi:hypothetical protein
MFFLHFGSFLHFSIAIGIISMSTHKKRAQEGREARGGRKLWKVLRKKPGLKARWG